MELIKLVVLVSNLCLTDEGEIEIVALTSCVNLISPFLFFFIAASQSGNVGVVHFLETKLDFDWLLEVGPDAPYVVLLPPDLFRRFEISIVYLLIM